MEKMIFELANNATIHHINNSCEALEVRVMCIILVLF